MSVSTLNMSHPKQGTSALAFGAIGVVFGDIGTSPLYTLRECLKAAGGVSQTNVFGVVSLILWSILVVVTFKYVCFVMRADSGGEGAYLRWPPCLREQPLGIYEACSSSLESSVRRCSTETR